MVWLFLERGRRTRPRKTQDLLEHSILFPGGCAWRQIVSLWQTGMSRASPGLVSSAPYCIQVSPKRTERLKSNKNWAPFTT